MLSHPRRKSSVIIRIRGSSVSTKFPLDDVSRNLAPFTARIILDDLSDRLRRGLQDHAAKGRERLGALRLSPETLKRGLRDARQSLSNARLSPKMAQDRFARDAERFAALERLHQSLNPKAPLKRGFVLVKDAEGNLVRSKADAATHPQLGVEFADGILTVSTGKPPPMPKSKPKRAKPRPDAAQDRQEDLFG